MPKNTLPSFNRDDFEIVDRQVVYEGVFRMARYQLKFRLFDGSLSGLVLREIMERKSAAAVLPYDPILDRVVLIEQFRAGAIFHPGSPWLVEVAAGLIAEDETPQEVALREANEEASCKILDLYPICEYFVSPGGDNEYIWLFCGRIDANNIDGIYGLPEENENIRAFTLSLEEAHQLLQAGKVNTAPAIISLQWLKLNRERLKHLWQIK
jgi:ADP-ribose pyrophosphatase